MPTFTPDYVYNDSISTYHSFHLDYELDNAYKEIGLIVLANHPEDTEYRIRISDEDNDIILLDETFKNNQETYFEVGKLGSVAEIGIELRANSEVDNVPVTVLDLYAK